MPGIGLAVKQLRSSARELKKSPPEAASGDSLFGQGAPLRTERRDDIEKH
jgi:hypothetical protein